MKFARWAFEKFPGAEDKLGTQMKAVGEVMSIGKTYKEAFQKSIRSLEIGRYGLGFAKDFHQKPLEELLNLLNEPSSERQFIMYEALRQGASVEALYAKTYIKPWFIQQMKELVELEEEILQYKGRDLPEALLARAKKDGFADRYLAQLLGLPEARDPGQPPRFRDGPGLGTGAGERGGKRGLLFFHLQCPGSGGGKRTGARSWFWAAAPTASARASSSITAACMPPSPFGMRALSPSWSTATRKPCPPTTTPRTSSISSP